MIRRADGFGLNPLGFGRLEDNIDCSKRCLELVFGFSVRTRALEWVRKQPEQGQSPELNGTSVHFMTPHERSHESAPCRTGRRETKRPPDEFIGNVARWSSRPTANLPAR
jgi:hypothetical protein